MGNLIFTFLNIGSDRVGGIYKFYNIHTTGSSYIAKWSQHEDLQILPSILNGTTQIVLPGPSSRNVIYLFTYKTYTKKVKFCATRISSS
jgi:hypothetical protein